MKATQYRLLAGIPAAPALEVDTYELVRRPEAVERRLTLPRRVKPTSHEVLQLALRDYPKTPAEADRDVVRHPCPPVT
jgi:hypothetical protein